MYIVDLLPGAERDRYLDTRAFLQSTVRPASTSGNSLPEIALPDQGLDFEATLGRIELSILGQALERAHGNKTLAADLMRLRG